MDGEWRPCKVGDLFELIPGYAFKSSEFTEIGTPVIKIKNVKPRTVVLDDLSYVRIQNLSSRERYLVQCGDILITMSGNRLDGSRDTWVGKVGQFRSATPCLLNQRVAILRPKHGMEVDLRSCSYILSSDIYQEFFIAIATSSGGQANLSPNQILGADMLLPPYDEQRAIARILGALDDKIELNRRMNETLEAMARALFKSWFVDFDPIRAKAEGRYPGVPQALTDLFPARLVGSELGEIPQGWERRTVEQVCSAVTRGVTPRYEAGTKRYIINQRANRGVYLDRAELKELASDLEVPSDRYAQRWDVLVNCLGEGTLGRVHLFKGESDTYAVDQHMSICRGATAATGAYLYQLLASPAGQQKIESLKSGSTGMTMFNISKLRGFDLLWPDPLLIEAYFRLAKPCLMRAEQNESQSRTLAALRDALLPKLISGELRVKDAETIAEAARA